MRREEELANQNQSHLVFKFDDKTLSPFTIQEAYDRAKNQNQKSQALEKIFSFIQNLRQNKLNPNNQEIRGQIHEALNNNIVEPFTQNKQSKFAVFNPQKVYAMNKDAGVRNGRFVDKGVMEFQDKKQPKLKQIKSFINIIEQPGTKSTFTKIEWLKDTKKYPFRIILIDKNKADKCVYFESLPEAQAAQTYLIQKYKLKLGSDSVKRIMNVFSTRWECMHVESFKNVLVKNMKKQAQSQRDRAKNKIKGAFSQTKKHFQQDLQDNFQQSQNDQISSFNRQSHTKTQNFKNDKDFDGDFHKKDHDKYSIKDKNFKKKAKINGQQHQQAQEKIFPLPAFYKVQSDYIKHFTSMWKQKALEQQQKIKLKKMEQERKSIRTKKNASISGNQSSIIKYSLGETLDFLTIEFLQQITTFFKPIIEVSLLHNNAEFDKIVQVFNTFLIKKQPTLIYKLIAQKPIKLPFQLESSIKQYQLQVKISDLFSGENIYKERILLGSKIINQKLFISSSTRKYLKLQCQYSNAKIRKIEQEKLLNAIFSNFIQQAPEQEQNLKDQEDFKDQQDFTEDLQIKISELSNDQKQRLAKASHNLSFKQPLYFYLQEIDTPSEEEYQILLKIASVCSQLNIQVTQNYLSLLRLLKQSNTFSDLNQITEAALSIILNWYHNLWDNQGRFYIQIGFQNDQIDKPDQKMKVMSKIFQQILQKAAEELYSKLIRKNIPIKILFLQYCHNLFSKNLPTLTCLSINSYIFSKYSKAQLHTQQYFILLMVWLCQYYEEQLKKVQNIKQARDILQSKNTTLFNQKQIMKELIAMQNKYFKKVYQKDNNKKEEKKKDQMNFQSILYWFYQNQGKKLDQNKLHRHVQKTGFIKNLQQIKLNQSSLIQIPYYKAKSFCLHIVFTSLPKTSGSLYLRCSDVQYRLQNYQKNPYFILPSVNSSVNVQFIDAKSNQYSFELQLIKGFGYFTKSLTNSRGFKFDFQYWAGIFTQEQLQNLKNGNSVQNSLSSLLKIDQLKYSFQRQISQSKLLQSISTKYSTNNAQLVNKIKIAFSQYQNKLNQYELFLYILAESAISVKEKIYMIYEYCSALSHEFFLCQNHVLERMMIWDLIKLLQFPIEREQFQAYYQNWLKCQIHSARVFKARFFTQNQKEQVKLQAEINKYLAKRANSYLYSDIQLDDLLPFIKSTIQSQLGGLYEGTLKIVVSTHGTLKDFNFNIVLKNHSKDLAVDQNSLTLSLKEQQIQRILQNLQPVLLKSQVDPNIVRGSSLLSFSRKLNLQDSRINDTQNFQAPMIQVQKVNFIKFILKKSKRIIQMRYKQYPKQVRVPFLQDFSRIMTKQFLNKQIKIQKFFQNGQQASSYEIFCNQQNKLKFSQNQNSQIYEYNLQIGIQNNLRKLLSHNRNKKTIIKNVYFYTFPKQELTYPIGRVFVNYGLGVFRWERCEIKGYFDEVQKKQKNSKKKIKNKSKFFLVQISNGEQILTDQKYIKLPPRQIEGIQKLDQTSIQSILLKQKIKA